MELSSRQQKILTAVVEHYIATGEPAGSKMLCDSLDFTVSSATVRNEMSELADRGLLLQPHTSAGRIPSQKGYRVYVDRLMKRRPLSPEERRTIDSLLLSASYDPQRLLEGVSRLLAGMTRFAAVSTSPGGAGADVRAVQFVQTSRRTAMAILITSAGTMKTRVFHCDFDLTPDILRVFFRTVNERVAGRGVEEITPAFIQGLAASQGEMAILMSSALMAVLDAAQEAMAADVCLHGQMNLLFCPEFEGSGARARDRLPFAGRRAHAAHPGAGHTGCAGGRPAGADRARDKARGTCKFQCGILPLWNQRQGRGRNRGDWAHQNGLQQNGRQH